MKTPTLFALWGATVLFTACQKESPLTDPVKAESEHSAITRMAPIQLMDASKFRSGSGDCYYAVQQIMSSYNASWPQPWGMTIVEIPYDGTDISQISFNASYTLNANLESGKPGVAYVKHGSSGHYIVITGRVISDFAGYNYTYMDPLAPTASMGCDLSRNVLIYVPGMAPGEGDFDFKFRDTETVIGQQYDVTKTFGTPWQ